MNNERFAIGLFTLAACGFVVACTAMFDAMQSNLDKIPVIEQRLDGLAQDQCVAEAGTRAQADDCRCRVRIQYPSAPQCAALPDGGWVLPAAAPHTDGAVQ